MDQGTEPRQIESADALFRVLKSGLDSDSEPPRAHDRLRAPFQFEY